MGKRPKVELAGGEGEVQLGVFRQSRNTAVFLSFRDLPHSAMLPLAGKRKTALFPGLQGRLEEGEF